MWPYKEKKEYPKKIGRLDFSDNKKYPVLTKVKTGLPEKEYFKRLTMQVSVGLRGFPANRIASDGRIVRQYGINEHDVTDEFLVDTPRVSGLQPRRQNQLHRRNVSQLKVVLDLPERPRRDSIPHLTRARVRNEVVPPMGHINNEGFLSEELKNATTNLQSKVFKLPPLIRRRSSTEQAKKLEKLAELAKSEENNKYVLADETNDQLDEDGLPVIKRRLSRRDSSVHFNPDLLGENRPPSSNGFRRRKSTAVLRYKHRGSVSSDMENPTVRKDSVGVVTESIREQFKTALQRQQMRRSSEIESVAQEPVLSVGHESIVKSAPTETTKSTINGYKVRHDYGKNLEKNWFMDHIMKKQRRASNANANGADYDLRLSIFYSPEPQSDGDLEGTADEDGTNSEEEASLHCGGYSTATAKIKSRRQSMAQSIRQTLDDANADTDEQSDGDSSNTDIELILKDNELIQRKTKNKMKKKRQRQLERYRAFLPPAMDVVKEQHELLDEVPLTDQEIRALRLNLKHKEKTKNLKGKRKFIQIVNVVYAMVQFRNILRNIRQRKRQLMKKKQQKIAQLVAKRLAKKANDYEKSQRIPTPKPTLKDIFMKELGQKLIFDVERLKISLGGNTDIHSDTDSDTDTDDDDAVRTPRTDASQGKRVSEPKEPSKYELELRKVSLTDVENAPPPKLKKRKRRRHRKRRHSVPKPGNRPTEFIVEVPVKYKRRSRSAQKKQKDTRRPVSPQVPKCTCYRERLASKNVQKCSTHQPEVKKAKMKQVKVQTGGLMRTHSLPNIAKTRPIELQDLLADIDIPAKDIKLQILARKFRRQRRKRQQVRLSPCRLPERPTMQLEDSNNGGTDSSESDSSSDESDYDFVYGGPFVGTGVMWNQNAKDRYRRTWTEQDVDREVERITRLYHEMKECTYLRLDGFSDAIMNRLKKLK